MSNKSDRTQAEISARELKALRLRTARNEVKFIRVLEQLRFEKPEEYVKLVCQGVLGISFDDSGAILMREKSDKPPEQRTGSQNYFSYLASLCLRKFDIELLNPSDPFVSMASWIESDSDLPTTRYGLMNVPIDPASLNGTAGMLEIYVSKVRWAFFETAAEALNYSMMKASRMVYRGVPLFERHRDNVDLVRVEKTNEDYVYIRQMGKRGDRLRSFDLPDWAHRYFMKTDHIKLHDAIFFSDWDLSKEELDLRRNVLITQVGSPSGECQANWPWGNHETTLLNKLAQAAHEWSVVVNKDVASSHAACNSASA